MDKSQKPPWPTCRTNLPSCVRATIFLIFMLIVISVIYFTLFKPKNPNLTINAVNLPFFYFNNSAATFIFSQNATVTNPNRGVFSHYDSSIQLLYAGNEVGFMFIPSGKIAARRTQYMVATFSSVKPLPIALTGQPVSVGVGPSMEVESRLEMTGRVRVLHFFSHHVESRVDCRVSVSVSDGSVLGFRC